MSKISDIINTTSNTYEVINNASELQNIVIALLQSAKFESNGIFATSRAFHRQVKAGSHAKLIKTVKERNIKSRLLVPMDEQIQDTLVNYRMENLDIDIKHIEKNSISIVLIDRKHALIAELQDDSKDDSFEAISRVVYTNSPSSVSYYSSLFESFWEQANLYERTKNETEQTRNDIIQMKNYIVDIMDEMSIIKAKDNRFG
jgi:hypothetical protein